MGNLYKVTDNRTSVSKKFHELVAKLDNYKEEVFTQLAETIVNASPVDTGTYMDNHHVSDTGKRQRARGSESSHGKPRQQAKEPYAEAAKARLAGEIQALPSDGRMAYFYNTSEHAPQVEAKHGPYDHARSAFRVIVETAWSSANGSK